MDLNLIINHPVPTLLFIVLSVFYFALLISIYTVLRNLKNSGSGGSRQHSTVSIIIAARNEEARIKLCLNSLSKLEYPAALLEVIIVDDHSTDNTAEIVSQFCQNRSNWNLIKIQTKSHKLLGKKNALQTGIQCARGELIFTTDADCIVGPGWIKKMSHYFKADVAMVIGCSPLIHGSGFVHRFIEFDTLFSAIVAAASALLGYPYTSTGRNLAYTKEAYHESGGFLSLKKYKSGDDMHLTRRFREKKIGKIAYCADPDTFVHTFPTGTRNQFIQQHIRKNSKIMHSGFAAAVFAFLMFTYHVLLYTIPFIFSADLVIWETFFISKFLLEYFVLHHAVRIFRQTQLISFLPVVQMIYPPFIIFFSFLGIFQKYKWKN